MSGRAGRRGKDERGICIIMIDEQVFSYIYAFEIYALLCSYILTKLNLGSVWLL